MTGLSPQFRRADTRGAGGAHSSRLKTLSNHKQLPPEQARPRYLDRQQSTAQRPGRDLSPLIATKSVSFDQASFEPGSPLSCASMPQISICNNLDHATLSRMCRHPYVPPLSDNLGGDDAGRNEKEEEQPKELHFGISSFSNGPMIAVPARLSRRISPAPAMGFG